MIKLRFLLSTLADAGARETSARALAAACALGYAGTLAVMVVSGTGLRRWFFALVIWGALIYAPLRILLEAFQTIAPQMRRTMFAQAATRPDRYGSRPSIELMVDGLFARAVVMPRIATPVHTAKAKEGAAAILAGALREEGDGVQMAAVRCLAGVERWAAAAAAWAAARAPANIQARWADIRALAGLAAASKVLIAAYEDRSGRLFTAGSAGGAGAAAYLDACLDLCDQLALEVDVVPWSEPGLDLGIDAAVGDLIRQTWRTFSDTPSPAPTARKTFVDAVLTRTAGPGIRDQGPGTRGKI